MATPSYNNAGQTSSGTSASTLTLSSFSANSGSNRFMEVWVGSGAGSPVAPSGVTWGGVSLTQRGNTQTGTYWRHSKWYLKEANFPGGATGDVVATWGSDQDERSLCVIVHSDVNQTSPYRNASGTEEVDTSTNSPSVNVTSDAADVVTAGMFAVQSSPEITGVATSSGTERCDTGPIAGGYEIGSASTQTGAATATVSWTISSAGTAASIYILADSLQGEAGGGGGVPKQMDHILRLTWA